MLGLTYLYNLISLPKISIPMFVATFVAPSALFWYVVFVYNDFLSLSPINREIFVSLFFLYLYMTFLICRQHKPQFACF